MSQRRVILIAGRREEAEHFARSRGLREGEWVFARSPRALVYMDARIPVQRVGTWYERTDLLEITMALRLRRELPDGDLVS